MQNNESMFSYSISGKSNLSAPTEPIGGSQTTFLKKPLQAIKEAKLVKEFGTSKTNGFGKS